MSHLQKEGRRVIELEAKALQNLANSLDQDFDKAIKAIYECKGKIVLSGMGKPGIIARKISSTFSSLGTSSFFMHPAEAAHGDLGMLTKNDIIILISNSGDSTEIASIIPAVKAIGITLIAITGKRDSILGRGADICLSIGDIEEACALGLAPTSSTTAFLALGDALAVALMKEKKDFDEKNYAFYHPGGSLGKRLLRVFDIMRKGEEAVILPQDILVKQVLFAITKARAGCAVLVGEGGRLSGIFSDGDLRRNLEKNEGVLKLPVSEVMVRDPKFISDSAYAMEALKKLKDYMIGDLPVVNKNGIPIGVVSLKDLISIGIV